MNVREIKNTFLGDDGTCIPLVHKRRQILYNVGRILINKYDGIYDQKNVMRKKI